MAGTLLTENDAQTLLAAALKIIAGGEPEMELAERKTNSLDTAHVEMPLGRMQGMNPRRLADYLCANTTLTPRQVGDIEIHSNTSYVEVPMDKIDEAYEALAGYERNRKSGHPRFGLSRSGRNKNIN